MSDYEPGPFADTPRRDLTDAGELVTLTPLAEQFAADIAPYHASLEAAHGALTQQTTIDVDGALNGSHAELSAAADAAAQPIDITDLNVAAVNYGVFAGDLAQLESVLPPEARSGPPPPFVPPPESEPPEEPSPAEPPLI